MITASMVQNNVDSFDVLNRKSVYNFRRRLFMSDNTILNTISNSLFFFNQAMLAELGIKFCFKSLCNRPFSRISSYHVFMCLLVFDH